MAQTVEQAFSSRFFWVIADVTSHTFKAQSNYHYFELVEKDACSSTLKAKFTCKAWGQAARRIVYFEEVTGQQFGNNINVLIKTSVQYHPAYGLQLNLVDIDTNYTLGMLEQQRQQTLQKLVTDNPAFIQRVNEKFITRNNQLRLSAVIQRVAVISSSTSAGLQDFSHTLETNPRGHRYYIDYYFSRVQGDGNAGEVVQKIIEVYHSKRPYDAMAIIRGGGAQTDFLIFDNYAVGRAVAKFPIPIITGIGHQKNETIVDLMAHTQTKTPTKAAEFIIAHNTGFEHSMLSFQKSIVIKAQQMMAQQQQSLSGLNSLICNHSRNKLISSRSNLLGLQQVAINTTKSLLFKHYRNLFTLSTQITAKPVSIITQRRNELSNIKNNLRFYNRNLLANQQRNLRHFNAIVRLMSPVSLLGKGFAVIKVDGTVTCNPDDIEVGKQISIIFSNKEIVSAVLSKSDYHGDGINV